MNLDAAKLQLKRSQLLKRMRMGLVTLLLTSDAETADAMTEAVFLGLVCLNARQEKQKQRKDRQHGKK